MKINIFVFRWVLFPLVSCAAFVSLTTPTHKILQHQSTMFKNQFETIPINSRRPHGVVLLLSRQLIAEGMEAFRNGDIQGSIDKFDASVPPGSRGEYLWQRGISYYYANDFAKGSQQFRDDVKVSPLDVEEIVWDIACLARLNPDAKFPPSDMLSLPPGKKDRRPIMSVVYALFRGEATEQELAEVGNRGRPGEEFYSLLYLGLYNEIRGQQTQAENYMKAAVKTRYAKVVGSDDYMVDVARIHCKLRGWL